MGMSPSTVSASTGIFLYVGVGSHRGSNRVLVSNESLSPRTTWSTKLTTPVPGFALLDPIASAETTIKDAMAHRSGLPRHDTMYKRNSTVESVVRRFMVLFKALVSLGHFACRS